MAIYLIDYENTKNLSGINNLSVDDRVIIFYSQKANTLSFDIHKEIIASEATIEYKFVDVGSQNALDFQLCSYLGYIIGHYENKLNTCSERPSDRNTNLHFTGKRPIKCAVNNNGISKICKHRFIVHAKNVSNDNDCKIFIVSKDKGFSFVSAFWQKEKNIEIKIIADLTGKAHEDNVKKPAPKSDTASAKPRNEIEDILKNSEIKLSDKEMKEITAMVKKYKTTQTININLNKLLKDSAKTGAILKLVKPFIKK